MKPPWEPMGERRQCWGAVWIAYLCPGSTLAKKVQENAAVVSDYAPGTPPETSNFPPRNRIIPGLALPTNIRQAGVKSCALITTDFSVE